MTLLKTRDPWLGLSRFTAARIALGRAGGSVRTETLLEFRLAHARARDAVTLPFDAGGVAAKVAALGVETFLLETEALDRRAFLLRPDQGRRLHERSRSALLAERANWGARDLCIVISDGLSALAAERQAVPLLSVLLPLLAAANVSLFPLFIAPFARVKLADEVGELLGARQSLILLGERPGLSSPDSMGAYVTYGPRAACTDADRNCVSNIRAEGLPCPEAARTLADLLLESIKRGLSGIELKALDTPRDASRFVP